MQRKNLKKAKRIVIKVGTALLTKKDNHINPLRVKRIVSQIAKLKEQKLEPVIVTSGAVALGLGAIKSTKYPKNLSEKQALAAMGQSRLMHMYQKYFTPYKINIGQIILTTQDLQSRGRYVNVRNTFLKLIEMGAVPIVNENDTVSIEEIRFGDNDTLSANIAVTANADLLIILSDIGGLFNKNPKKNRNAKRIKFVNKINSKISKLAEGSDKATAIGGMETKLKAAKIACSSGIPVVIASGIRSGIIENILQGKDVGTFFASYNKNISQKKKWIAHSTIKNGSIIIDNGCKNAIIKKGKSILPVGVKKISGQFKRGDSIFIFDENNNKLGVGLSNFSSNDFKELIGKKNKEEIIHCDNLVITENMED